MRHLAAAILFALLSVAWGVDYPPVVINNGHTQNLRAGDNIAVPSGSAVKAGYLTATDGAYVQTFTATGASALNGTVTMGDGINMVVGSTSGTKIGTATTQKLGFFNATPIVQPTGDLVTAMQNLGLGASLTVTATTNANLTGPITSVGNATSIASQTGTGTTFVMQASPTLTTPTMQDSTDTTKKLVWICNLESTAITTTISTGAQTGSRTFSFPVAAASDTIGLLGTAGTWTAAQTLELPFITDATDATKKIGFTLSGASTGTTLTIISSQTASRSLTVPLLAGNDSFATLAVSQTFSGSNTFSSSNTFGNRVRNSASMTAVDASSGSTSIYRINGTLDTIGSLGLQTDPNQSTGVVALIAGSPGANCFTSGTAASTVFTGFADGNNIAASFSTGGSATIAAAVLTEINTNTSTLGSYFLWLPASPVNGQIVEFVSEGTITALTTSGNGHTLVNGATTITGPGRQVYIYNTAATTWYREQ